MSSRTHQSRDPDAALTHTPSRVRHQAEQTIQPGPYASPASSRGEHSTFSGDRAMKELQRQLALTPDKVPEPPTENVRRLTPVAALRLCAFGGAVVLIGWAMASVSAMRKSIEPVVPASLAPPVKSNLTNDSRAEVVAQPTIPDHLVEAVEPPRQATLVPIPPLQTATTKHADASPVSRLQSAPPKAPNLADQLDHDEIATLIKRAEDFLANNDFSSARLLLRRAAEAGSASAALTLGGTFDPLVQRQHPLNGAVPDIARAREWYKRAADLGSAAAFQRLENLTKISP